MRPRSFTLPEIALIAGTRMALGAGVGLLLADKLNDDERRGAGWALVAVGILTTGPLLANLLSKNAETQESPRRVAA